MRKIWLLVTLLLIFGVMYAKTPYADIIDNPSPISIVNNNAVSEGNIRYEIVWQIPITSSILALGVTPVCIGTYPEGETLLWVSHGGASSTTTTDNWIVIYNLNTRTLVDSFPQPANSGWGYRDMCFYNGYVYAGYEGYLDVYDPVTKTRVGNYAVSTPNPVRALTDNNVEDTVWTANFVTPIYKLWNQGGAGRAVNTAGYSLYGLAYDNFGYMWGFAQNPMSTLVKYSYPALNFLDSANVVEIINPLGDSAIAGGCEMWRDSFLLILGQAKPLDKVYCLRVYFPPINNDVGIRQILAPTGVFNPRMGISTPVSALVENTGLNNQTNFAVLCTIWGPSSTLEYTDSRIISLNSNDTVTVFFNNWTPSVYGTHTVIVRTTLSDDYPLNDRKTTTVSVAQVAMTGGPDAGYYWWIDSDAPGGPVYNWIDISATGDTCRTGDEQRSARLPIGFTFNFYDKPRNFFWFSTNGFISFDSLTSAYLTNASIPNSALPNNLVAPFWDDMVVMNSWHQTFYSPDTYKVITWRMRRYTYNDTVICQVILKANGDIIMQYNRCQPGSYGLGQSATVGIEDSTGTMGLRYLYNDTLQGNRLADGRAIRFYKYRFANDVGVMQITSPLAQHIVGINMVPKAIIKNYGTNPQSFVVRCSIINRNGTVRHLNQQSVTSLAANDTITLAFGSWTPNIMETLTVYVTTYLAGDEYAANNQKTQTTEISNKVVIGTGTTGGSTYTLYGYYNYAYSEQVYLQSEMNFTGFITKIGYYKTAGTNTTQFDTVAIFMKLTPADTAPLAGFPDTTGYTLVYFGSFPLTTIGWLEVDLNVPFFYDNVNNLSVLIFKGPPAMTSGYPSFAYTTTTPFYRNRYGYGPSLPTSYNYRTYYRSNIRLTVMPLYANDVGVQTILYPLSTHAVNLSMTPKAILKNYGTNANSFVARCSIINSTGNVRHLNQQTITNLAAGDTITKEFGTWTPTVVENLTVYVTTYMAGDENLANDVKTKACNVINYLDAGVNAIVRPYASKENEYKRVSFLPQVTIVNNSSYDQDIPVKAEILYLSWYKDFEADNGGFIADPPDTCWQWGVPTTVGPTSAHSGTKCWGTKIAGNYSNSANWKLTTPTITANANNPILKFWHWYNFEGTSTRYDAGNVKISINGGPWTLIRPVGGYGGVAYTSNVGIPGESAYVGPNGTFWQEATFILPVTAGQQYNIRWHFGSDPSVNSYAGWYIDDVSILEPIYVDSTLVEGVPGLGGTDQAYLPSWTPNNPGQYYFKGYTKLSGDMNTANDEMSRPFNVALYPMVLQSPANGSTTADNTPTFVWNEVPGAELYRIEVDTNPTFPAPIFSGTLSETEIVSDELNDGTYYWRVRVESPLDPDPWSDVWSFTVATVAPGWTQKEAIPEGEIKPGKMTKVKDGGSMVAVGSDVYIFVGGKSDAFYKYSEGVWDTTLMKIPFSLKYKPGTPLDSAKWNNKKVGKGAAMCFDGDNTIYATKGNGTWEFFAYDLNADTWIQKAYVPTPKAPKAGTALAYKDGIVYMLVGGVKAGEDNFFAYLTATDTWITLSKAILDDDGKPFKDGSCLAVMGNKIYALKGKGKENHLYEYDITSGNWTHLANDKLPLIHPSLGKGTKVGDGGAMTTDGACLYAIKGGGKQDFWVYDPTLDSARWRPLDTIPRLAKASVPKTGAAIAYGPGRVWLMKGNKTDEFWVYGLGGKGVARPMASTITSTMTENNNKVYTFAISVTPNPVSRTAVINYSLPMSTKASLKLYNSSGQLVEILVDNILNAGSYTQTLNATTLAKGVYFLKYEANGDKSEVKLIVQ